MPLEKPLRRTRDRLPQEAVPVCVCASGERVRLDVTQCGAPAQLRCRECCSGVRTTGGGERAAGRDAPRTL